MKKSLSRKAFIKMKQRFCTHVYPQYWNTRFTKGPGVIFWRMCPKCGKVEEVEMPIDNIIPAYEQLQKLRRRFK